MERVIAGNVRGHGVAESEIRILRKLMTERKAMPSGRGLWFSGSPGHGKLGGAALNNCWYLSLDDWQKFVTAADLLMLGGGVGASVESRFVSQTPRVKRDVVVQHKLTKDADFIVPDSREGWCEALRRLFEAYFVTGRSYDYSCVCVRGAGERIAGFGGTASGPVPLIECLEKISTILRAREGKRMRPIDAADVVCAIGEMVVSGNVRRSAIILLGDPWDKDFLRAKRWDLGPIPTQRSRANFSVVCDDVDDLHPLYWRTYEAGEAFGLVNRTAMQRYGRAGEERRDTAVGVNPCGEATLEDQESCNLQNQALPNYDDPDEFVLGSRMMHRWGKRVACDVYHLAGAQAVISRNRRIGTSITGCLQRPDLFCPEVLDRAYTAIWAENVTYSAELGIPLSIRATTVNPGGTTSKLMDVDAEGLHGALSRYQIQRIRFSGSDKLLPALQRAGHHMEPEYRFDGTADPNTMVVDFYRRIPDSVPCEDEGWDTWKQLEVLKVAQRYWADQSVSVTVYYRRDEIQKIKEWLAANLAGLKTISFLPASDHGFRQAPKEAITADEYEKLSSRIRPLDLDGVGESDSNPVDECASGACPVR